MATSKGYECEFVDSIFDDLYCRSCSLVARKLIVCTNCMESFCHSCAVGFQKEDEPCLACLKKPFTILEHPKNQKRVNNLRVCCSLKKRWCGWIGTLDDLQDHLDPEQDNCLYVDIMCPLNCSLTISKNVAELHVANDCVMRTYVCQHCNFTSTYEEVVDNHLPKCKFVALQCPNRCGVTCERDFMEDHMKTCRLEVISCEFNGVGCNDRFTREDLDRHDRENCQKHLAMAALMILKTKEMFLKELQNQEEKLFENMKGREKILSEQEVTYEKLVKRILGLDKVLEANIKRIEEKEKQVEEQLKRLENEEAKMKELVNKTMEMKNEFRVRLENQEKKYKEQEQYVLDKVNERLMALEVKFEDQNIKFKEQQIKMESQEKTLKEQECMLRELTNNQEKLCEDDKEQNVRMEVFEQKQDSRWQDMKQLLMDVSLKSDQNDVKVAKLSTHLFLNRRFEMKNFTMEKMRDKPSDWRSPFMYTHVRGYKFCIGVDASGTVYGCGNAIGLVMYAMQGEFDDELKWPIKVKFGIELINQRGSENARRSEISSLWYRPRTRHSIVGSFNQSHGGFLEHSKLNGFLNNDTLYFYITEVQLYL